MPSRIGDMIPSTNNYDMVNGSASNQEGLVRGFLESGHSSSLGKRARGWIRRVRSLVRQP